MASIEEQLRMRTARRLLDAFGIGKPLSLSENGVRALNDIMGDVEVALVLKARAAYSLGRADGDFDGRTPGPNRTKDHRYPLPKRTRRMLREEPDPEIPYWAWRVRDGAGPLEV